jgi:hypothetical protein
MSLEDVFDVILLVAILLGGAAAGLLVLAPFVFESMPGGLKRSRPLLLSLVALAVALFLVEWLVIH